MFNKVILTFTTRILTAILSIVNVLIGTNYLGVEGYGTISLVILGITIYLMIQNILTGSSIVYFTSKFKDASVITISYIWTIFSILFFTSVVVLSNALGKAFDWSFELLPSSFMWQNITLAGAYGLMAIHLNLLLGKERIKAYNFIFFFQHLLSSILLIIFFIILEKDELSFYLISLLISYISSYILALFLSLPYFKDFSMPKYSEFKSMFKYGVLGQSANVFQLVNYRLSYYLIDIFAGRASLGVFSAATQLSEGLWIFGKSIATVHFAHLSNKKDNEYAKNLSTRLVKFTSTITLAPLIVLMLMPNSFYTMLLGDEFEEVRVLIRLMSIGTVSLASSMILSSYFSGTGKIVMNSKASGLGMISTLIIGIIIIPALGEKGASITTSLSYLVSLIYLFLNFNKIAFTSWKDWLINKKDISESWLLIKNKIGKN